MTIVQLRPRTAKDGPQRNTRRFLIGAASAALLAPVLAVPAGAETISEPTPQGGLAFAGPVDPVHGFPQWYEDKGDPARGLAPVRLELCLDDPLCLAVAETPDPAQPVSFPGNFPGEAFWWAGEADMTNGTVNALLVMAAEAAFGAEVAEDGQQVSFNRLRIRVDGLQLGETYTVTHPYGVDRFVAEDDGKGGGEINATEDIGCFDVPCAGAALDRPLNGRVGPFLRWESGAPAGHIGDPNVPHTVVGSPYDTNFFRVEGPGLSMETGLFAIQGKIAGPAAPFTDVAPSNQFFNEISWLKEQGVSTGFPNGAFQPVTPVNRDAMAAFMYRLKGSPAFTAPATSPFADLATNNQFYKEISWLAAEGISTGFPDDTYRYLQPVNRDAMAAFLYRLAGSPAFTAPEVSPFLDVTTDNQFYKEITWLESTGITTGFDDDTFRPVSPVNRDAMAAFMFRWNALFGDLPVPAPVEEAPADPAAPADEAPVEDAAPVEEAAPTA
jgi:hypothetical protein